MKRKKIGIGSLFYNDKFVMAFAIFSSVILWFVMASTNSEDFPHAIYNVPVVINLSQSAQEDGLKVFSPTNQTATVTIKGNSLIVKQIQASDLQVVAQLASTITAPGSYPVNLTAQKIGTLSDFDVVSVSPSQAIISVDRYKEKTFTIENDIKYKPDYKSDPAYFVSAPTLSSDTVTISGPEKDISQVNKVAIEYEIGDTLKETKSFTTDLILYDANGNKITSDKLKMSIAKVDVTIPVLSRLILPLEISFVNKPAGLLLTPAQVTIDPQSIEVAGPKETIQDLTSISLTPIDFANISPTKNTFDITVPLPMGCKNLSSIPVAKVTMNLGALTTRTMVVNNFKVVNLASDKASTVYTKNLSVTVVGPQSEIATLTENNLIAQIDMAGKENFTGHTEMPATISVSNGPSSWVYGTYMANISVSEK